MLQFVRRLLHAGKNRAEAAKMLQWVAFGDVVLEGFAAHDHPKFFYRHEVEPTNVVVKGGLVVDPPVQVLRTQQCIKIDQTRVVCQMF